MVQTSRLDLRFFLRECIPIASKEELFDAKATICYGYEGGIIWSDFKNMKKWEFNRLIDWFVDQKKKESDEIKKVRNDSNTSSKSSGKMKYLDL